METPNNLHRNIGLVASVVIFVGVVIVSVVGNRKSTLSVTTSSPITTTQTVSVPVINDSESESEDTPYTPPVTIKTTPAIVKKPVVSLMRSVYKDGSYTATGSYMSPGGQDQIGVTLTLANDIITDVSINPQAGDRTSSRYMARFASGYKQYVVGKNIADVNLTNVSGSSLTPIGFNDALNQIKAQAKA